MTPGRLLLLLAAACILASQGPVALAYEDTGYDPVDRESDYPDVLSTTRRVETNDGRRLLGVSFTSKEELAFDAEAYWSMRVKLDTRGDQTFDVVMEFWDLDMSGSGCIARNRDGRGKQVEGRLHLRSHGASCTVRTAQFRLRKRVRWKLMSPALHDPGEVEYAPNAGYYS
jgi:hypothetical protein